MADLIGPFDTAPWSQTEWYSLAPTWAPSGIIGTPAGTVSSGDFGVTAAGLNVTVACNADRAWIDGSGYKPDSDKVITVTANGNASLSRRDRLVIRRDLAAKTITVVRLAGTPASTPAAPTLTQTTGGIYDLPICSFLVPPNNGTTLTGFIDERVWIDPGGNGRVHPRSRLVERVSGTVTDAYGATRTNLLGDTWVAAPAGDYLVHATVAVQATTTIPNSGEVFIVANGTTITKPGTRADAPADVLSVLSYTRPYTHTGGDLAVTLDHHPNGGVTVSNATTQMVLVHLGQRG